MTDSDKELLAKAYKIAYDDYDTVTNMIMMAETDECREKLTAIRDLLFDIHIGRGV